MDDPRELRLAPPAGPQAERPAAPAARPGLAQLSPERRRLAALLLRERGVAAGPPPIPSRDPTAGPPPLSFEQLRLWFLHQLEPASTAYHLTAAYRVLGGLDVARLRRCLAEVVSRQAVLRTRFTSEAGEPVQTIAPRLDLTVPLLDLGGLASAGRERQVRAALEEVSWRPYDLAAGPVCRFAVLACREDGYVVVAGLHHIAADGWSIEVLMGEIAALYDASVAGRPSPLAALPVQYADFAAWQRGRLRGEALAAELAYWRERLAGAPALLELPADRPRPPVRRGSGAAVPLRLDGRLAGALRGFARQGGATLFMALLAGFQALLARLSGQDDVCVGTPVAGRQRVELEGLIGFFANTLVVRTTAGGVAGFAPLLARVREAVLAAHAHQDLPFEKLVEELAPERSLSHTPLFQAMLVLKEAAAERPALGSLRLEALATPDVAAKCDLALSLAVSGESLVGALEYSSELFDAVTVRRWGAALVRLLAAAVEDAETGWHGALLLGEGERHQVVWEWNDTQTGWRADAASTLDGLVAARLAADPEAVALVCGGEAVSRGELARRAGALAARLAGLGCGDESCVGVLMERSVELVVALLGTLATGAAYLPLDPDHPAGRLAFQIADAGPRVILTQDHLAGRVPPTSVALPVLPASGWAGGTVAPSAGVRRAGADSLAYVIYTSGSTGRPKGVAVAHRAIVNRLLWMQEAFRLEPHDRVLHKTPFSFDVSVWELFAPLLAGAPLVIARPGGHRDAAYLARLIADAQVSVAHFVPSMLQHFLDTSAAAGCASLRDVVASGEALPAELAQRFHAALGARLHNLYGPTEAAVEVTAWRCERGVGAWRVPIGRPIGNVRIHLLDRDLRAAPIGVAAELYIGGVCLARGYVGRPDLTAERFVPDPAGGEAGGRLYRSGDLARRRADGAVEYLGRTDQQIKVRGFRIELGEIETVLAEHPGVREAAVLWRDTGRGEPRLAAYVAAAPAGAAGAAELRAFLRQRLPDYMVPADWVALAELPQTSSGKIDRRALAAVTPATPVAPEAALATPRTPVEEVVAAVWEDVLGLERQVGAGEHFFDLGGHSLLAVRVLARLRAAFGVELPLRAMFEAPTVAALAALLQAQAAPVRRAPPLVREAAGRGGLAVSFGQQRLWFIDRLEPGSAVYNLPLALQVRGPLQPAALAAARDEIERRHEVLRTVFRSGPEGVVQVVRPPAAPGALPLVDLAGLPADRRQAEALRLAAMEAVRPFDLAAGPVWRAGLLRLAPEEHVGLLTLHHIAADGWSLEVLMRELAALYGALTAGQPSPLAELPVQYADFAAWQRRFLDGEVLAAELTWWRERLAGAPALLELPTDRPRPAVRRGRGGAVPLHLGEDLVGALRGHARRHGATLFMALMAGFQALLARLSGQDEVAVGTPVAGRQRVELESLIGFFVNTLVVRTAAGGAAGAAPLLDRVREAVLAGHAHQEVPFEKLVEELAPERSLSHTPLFQVAFVYQDAGLPPPAAGDLSLAPLPLGTTTAKFDLTLTVRAGDDEHTGAAAEYDRDLFDAITVRRMLGMLRVLLAGIAAHPTVPPEDLPLLAPAELHQVTVESRAAGGPAAAAGASLYELFARQAERTPRAVALVEGGVRWTYEELDRRAVDLAASLRAEGVGPEEWVGLLCERGPAMVVAILAVLAAGGAYLPLDPAYPAGRLLAMTEETGVRALVASAALASRLPLPAAPAARPAVVLVDEDGRPQASRPAAAGRFGRPLADNAAYMIYTSGSTGRPKGVVITHGNVVRLFAATRAWLAPGAADVWTLFHSFAFDFSVWELFGALLHGGRLVLVPQPVSREPDAFRDLLIAEGVTVLNQTPAAFRRMIGRFPEAARRSLALRLVIFGGEELRMATLGAWFAAFGERCPRLVNMYGITETTVHVTARALDRDDLAPATGSPIGRPLLDLAVLVVDRRGQPAPAGVAGEAQVSGAGLARGYHGRPDLTAERFVPDPYSGVPGSRLYRTGDRVRRLRGGDLEFLGRLDRQVKIRGFRIETGEVEAALALHPAIARCAVAVWRDGDEGRLVGYLVPRQADAAPSAAELRGFLLERLPEHMVPAAFVTLAELPLTPNGKVDASALPALEAGRRDVPAAAAAPRTAAEAVLADAWGCALDVAAVGRDDNFFALGGDSILALRAQALVEQAGYRLSLQLLFRHQTIALLAPHLEVAAGGPAGERPVAVEPFALVPVADRERLPAGLADAYPLTELQLGMLFHNRLEPAAAIYHNVNSVRLRARFDAAALAAALALLIARHAVLRTAFDLASFSVPLQLVAAEAVAACVVEDLCGLPAAEQRARIAAWFAAEKALPFDWRQPPLLRFHVHLLDDELLQFGWAEHHAILDGWSVALLLRELFEVYRALLAGTAPALPALASRFRDFVALEQAALESPASRRFWQAMLAGSPGRRLPRWPAGDRQDADGAHQAVRWTFATDETAALAGLAAAHGVPLKSVLLAGHLAVLYLAMDRREVVTGVVAHGRPESDGGDRVLGLFLNTVPLALRLPHGSWADLARRVFAAEQEILPHRRYPLARLQRGSAAPLFDACFNFIHFHVLDGIGAADFAVEDEQSFAATNFTLLATFTQERELHLDLAYDAAELRPAQVRWLRDAYRMVLAAMTATPAAACEPGALVSGRGLLPPPLRRAAAAAAGGHSAPAPADRASLAPTAPAAPNQLLALRLLGPLRPAALAAARNEIERRHTVLRPVPHAASAAGDAVPQPPAARGLPLVDLAGLAGAPRQAEVLRLAAAEVARPFDPASGAAWRASLLRLAPTEHAALWTLHRGATDPRSLDLLMRELAALYGTAAAGRPSPLAELPVQYADYAAWRERCLDSVAAAELDYWRERLAGAPALLELPADRARPAVRRGAGAAVPLGLGERLVGVLRGLARQHGATLSMALLAAFQALLARLSGQDDICVGTPVHGRRRAEVEGLIGPFADTLVVRTAAGGAAGLAPLLALVRDAVLEAHAHQELPFAALAAALAPSSGLSHTPLFQAMLALQEAAVERPATLGELRCAVIAIPATAVRCDLTLDLAASGEALAGALEYSSELFDRATAVRWCGALERLLTAAVADVETGWHGAVLLSEGERHQAMAEWNDTQAVWRGSAAAPMLHAQVAAQAARRPEAIAVVCAGEALSYGELARRTEVLAARLAVFGCSPETCVGVLLERSIDLVVALLATLAAGAAYLPLDPDHPAGRLDYQIANARPRVILADERLAGRLPAEVAAPILFAADWAGAAAPPAALAAASGRTGGVLPPDADSPAYVIYTSGSTGRPKGVAVSHRAILNRLLWMLPAFCLEPEDRVLQKTPVSFDVSLWELCAPLLAGARLVMARPGGHRDAAYLARLIVAEGITIAQFVPSMLQLFLETPAAAECASLRDVVASGEVLPAELAQRFHATLGADLHNLYGPTEAAVEVTAWRCERGARWRVPIGRPIGNVRIHVLDHHLEPVPIGVAAELYIGGVCLARGYVGRPDLTAERFVPDPAGGEAGGRLYRSGDLARRRADGAVEYLGRTDQQIKVRGFRIEPGEIEAVLAEHPRVREAAVLWREMGRGERRLAAYVAGAAPHPAELRAFLRERLPEHMVPADFVEVPHLPLTASGKIDRRALAAATPGAMLTTAVLTAPRTPIEEVVAAIWEDVLGIARPVGTEELFFDLGGHSLLAVRVLARLQAALGVELPLRAIFEAPTVAALAVQVQGRLANAPAAPPLVRLAAAADRPVSFGQQRLWFIDRLEPGNAAYNLPLALRVLGPLRPAALAAARGEIERRHEVLRTVFRPGQGGVAQVVLPPRPAADTALALADLAGLPAARWQAEVLRLAAAEAVRPFDLAAGPVWRSTILRLAPAEHVGLLTLHHIAADGWSLEVLMRELAALYGAVAEGRPSPLPELPVQYADFAAWQRRFLDGEMLSAELQWWHERLAEAPALLDLPLDRPRPAAWRGRGAAVPLRLGEPLTGALRGLARRHGATLFMALMAGFQALLTRLSGQDDVCVGTPVAGRQRVEIEALIGFFVNTLVVRTAAGGVLGLAPLLARVREAVLEAHAHQDLPFEKLVEELAPERSLSRTPLFQAAFAYQGAGQPLPAAGELSLATLAVGAVTAKFDLTLAVVAGEAHTDAAIEYDSDLFDAVTVRRWGAALVRLLAAAVEDAETGWHGALLLGEGERHQVVWEWNDTQTGWRADAASTLDGLVAARLAADPEAVALVCGGEAVSRGELARRAGALAARLAGLGCGDESCVGVLMERSVELVVALLGTLATGAAYLPLDPDHPAGRLAFQIADAGPRVILTQDHLAGRVPPTSVALPVLPASGWAGGTVAPSAGVRRAGADSLAYVIYTSGSTGRPKGVAVAHRAIVNRLLWMQEAFRLEPHDRVLHKTPFSFDVSVWELFAPLLAGAPLVIARPGGHRDAAYLARLIADAQVSVAHFVPSMLQHFLDTPAAAGCASLRDVVASGEALPAELAQRFHAALGARLHNLYGPTEAAVEVTAWRCERGVGAWRVPIGRPIGNVRIHLLDRDLRAAPIGVAAELYIGGVCLARGYVGRPDLTAERFVPDPAGGEAGGRLYRSGDLARRRADGAVEYLGRTDQQIKVRGFRIELGEIETVLAEHPGVREAAVLWRDTGRGEPRLAAYVAAAPAGAAGAAELRAFLRQRLPDYMVPADWVALAELPQTSSGKIDRRALAQAAPGRTADGGASAGPRDAVELALTQIWEDLLDRRPIAPQQDFFALGGHSLLALTLVAHVERRFGVALPVETLIRAATVEGLARVLRRGEMAPASPLQALQPTGALPPFFCFHPIGGNVVCYAPLARRLGTERPFFGLQARGLDGSSPGAPTLEEMAADYVAALRVVQPAGPYHLGGWSFGGVLALEAARQLDAAGQAVAFLCLIDSYLAPQIGLPDLAQPSGPRSALAAFAADLAAGFGLSVPAALWTAEAADEAQGLAALHAEARRLAVLPPDAGPERLRELYAVYRRNVAALQAYHPGRYAGGALLLRPRATPRSRDAGGFRHIAQGGVTIRRIPGNHYTLLREPHVEVLARELRRGLDERATNRGDE